MCAIFRSTIKGLKVTHLNNRRFDEQRVKTEKKMFLQQMIKWRHGVFYVIICSNFCVNLRIDMLISNGKKYDIEDD